MLCPDTNCCIAYVGGDSAPDMELLDEAFRRHSVFLAPVVLTEMLSVPGLPETVERLLFQTPLMVPTPGYWERAGRLRAALREHDYRPKLADTLIAQSCLDHHIPLLTRDRGFRQFERHAGLVLA